MLSENKRIRAIFFSYSDDKGEIFSFFVTGHVIVTFKPLQAATEGIVDGIATVFVNTLTGVAVSRYNASLKNTRQSLITRCRDRKKNNGCLRPACLSWICHNTLVLSRKNCIKTQEVKSGSCFGVMLAMYYKLLGVMIPCTRFHKKWLIVN